MRRLLRDNGLSITVLLLFLIFWSGQLISGWKDQNSESTLKNQPTTSLREYIFSAHFAEATFENWESEFLQTGAYVLLTSFLFQRGSAESKDPDGKPGTAGGNKLEPNSPRPVLAGGWKLAFYKNSLSIVLLSLFALSFAGHALGGWREYCHELAQDGHQPVSFSEFLGSAHFWFQSLQNWQSEFLAVGTLVVLSIWLRQEGSPESKPLTAPHSQTGS